MWLIILILITIGLVLASPIVMQHAAHRPANGELESLKDLKKLNKDV